MTEITKHLKKELQTTAKPFLGQIRETEQRLKNKEASKTELEQEAQTLQLQSEELKDKATNAMEVGEDPRQYLKEANALRTQAEDLTALLNEGQVGSAERQELEDLKGQLFNLVQDQISNSEALKKQSAALLDALRNVVQVSENWDEGVKGVYADFGFEQPAFHQLLLYQDDSEESRLAGKLQSITNKHQHLYR